MARFIFVYCMIFYISFREICFSRHTFKRNVENPLIIGSFNIQNLGNKKLSNDAVMNIVRKIILRYDIILVQEIVTKDQKRMLELLSSINSLSKFGEVYDLKLSKRLGRGSAKEQYGYFFRTDKVTALFDEVYPDIKDDFMRPPYIIHFSTPTVDDLPSFVMIGIHTQPKNAASEISSLVAVYEYCKSKYRTKDIIILGDLNAGCAHVRSYDWTNINLWIDTRFQWIIGSDTDTTTNSNTCPYDRIVIAGENIKRAVLGGSAKAFDFQEEYGLTEEEAKSVSDHYPVEVKLKGN